MTSQIDVLIFVEDPGAANYVAEIPQAIREKGGRCHLLASGSAVDYLELRSIPFEIVPPNTIANELLVEASPCLLIVGTSENLDTLGLALVKEARSIGITSIGVIDAPMNADHRFRGQTNNPLAYAPDWVLVSDQLTKDTFIKLGFLADKVVICGHPHYDYVREVGARLAMEGRNALRSRLFPKISKTPDIKVIVFAAESFSGLNPGQFQHSNEYTLHGRGSFSNRTEIVLEEFLHAVRLVSPESYMILRLHPRNKPIEFSNYVHEFDELSHSSSPLELVFASDLIVGMTSALLAEAALLGRPTMSIIPRKSEKEWVPTIEYGVTKCATTSVEIRECLQKMLQLDENSGATGLDHWALRNSKKRTTDFVFNILGISREAQNPLERKSN